MNNSVSSYREIDKKYTEMLILSSTINMYFLLTPWFLVVEADTSRIFSMENLVTLGLNLDKIEA